MERSNIKQKVKRLEKESGSRSLWETERYRIPMILCGALIYSFGVNLFLRPLHLYSGGFMGFAQLITNLLRSSGLYHSKMDLAGFIYYLMNIPGLIIAYKTMRRRFLYKSVLSVSLITVLLTLVPIPKAPILDETIANCLVAGIMGGAGVGMILRSGSSDGGMDLIGMILIQLKGHYSVGMVNIAANAVLYTICLILFDVPTAIYSLIYSVISSTTCDKVHTQNINVEVLLVTKLEDTEPLEVAIMGSTGRGMTKMSATGSYSGQGETVFLIVLSKYEVQEFLNVAREYDPSAFIIYDENIQVEGHFTKKLT